MKISNSSTSSINSHFFLSKICLCSHEKMWPLTTFTYKNFKFCFTNLIFFLNYAISDFFFYFKKLQFFSLHLSKSLCFISNQKKILTFIPVEKYSVSFIYFYYSNVFFSSKIFFLWSWFHLILFTYFIFLFILLTFLCKKVPICISIIDPFSLKLNHTKCTKGDILTSHADMSPFCS